MNIKYIIIVLAEPYSIFSEIIGKYFSRVKKFNKKIIIIGNYELLNKQLKKLKFKVEIVQIKDLAQAKNNRLNLINIKLKLKKTFDKISKKSNEYIEKSFDKALNLIKNNENQFIMINGPVSKKSFLRKKYLGVTEYLSKKTKSKNELMLIYNKNLSVSPITTHIPIKRVAQNLNQKKIINNVLQINFFYKQFLKKKPKFAILGLNPHCETVDKFSEEEKIIIPSIKIW